MHERRFHGGADKLRTPERIALLEVEKAADLSLNKLNVKNVLDVGTGSGLFAEEFAKRGLEVTGIDVSEEMLEAASKHVPEGKFQKGPAEEIPFGENSFDLTFMGLVLHETDDLKKALSEVRRVSRSRVAVLEWPYTAGEYGPPLEHRINPEALELSIKEAGFKSYEKIPLKNLELFILTV